MKNSSNYTPPKVWKWEEGNGGEFTDINRPVSGSTHEKELPRGNHALQLYSLATPNGVKVTILLEELLAQGINAAEYDVWLIDVGEGGQFGIGFVEINPNSKIPAMLDCSGDTEEHIFESGSILMYLAEKFKAFIPDNPAARTTCMNWLFWKMGSAPYVGGGFGHFYAYAPEKFKYCIDRFSMETKRQLDVLDKHFSRNQYICGNEYSIADIAIWPWYGALVLGRLYEGSDVFRDTSCYRNLVRWAEEDDVRPAVQRGRVVNRSWGEEHEQLHKRHSASDIDAVL